MDRGIFFTHKLVPTKIFDNPTSLDMLLGIGLGTTYRNCFFICKPRRNNNQIFLKHNIKHDQIWSEVKCNDFSEIEIERKINQFKDSTDEFYWQKFRNKPNHLIFVQFCPVETLV